jgi:hypothetical protein
MLFHEGRELIGKDLNGFKISMMVLVGKANDPRHADAYFSDDEVASRYIDALVRLGLRKDGEFRLRWVLVLSDGIKGYVLGMEAPFDIKEAAEHELFTKSLEDQT